MSLQGRDRLWSLGLALIACATFASALRVGFFSDDFQWLGRMNATLERPSFVFTVFFRDFNPVLHASFALDWILGGMRAWVWHLDSIILHGITTALLFVLCRRLGFNATVSAGATILWALNVRISEAVIWPAARGHQLATVSAVGAAVLLLGHWRWRRVAALLLLTIGLFAKETTLVAMVALPFFLPKWKTEKRFLAALAGLGVGFVLLNLLLKDNLHTSGAGLANLLLKTPFILLRPLGLGDVYGFTFGALALVALVYLALTWWLRRGYGLGGMVWVLACSAPIVPLDKLSSRYLYLPAIGYSIIFCAVVGLLGAKISDPRSRRMIAVGMALVIGIVTLTNGVRIQREIGDYRLLSAPYMTLVEQVRPTLESLNSGDQLLVIDTAPQTTIRALASTINGRGNITKLIPYRRHALDGLIELPDLLNVARSRLPGTLGRALPEAKDDGLLRWFAYDGQALREIVPQTLDGIPIERVHRAAWGDPQLYFANPR